LFKTSACQIEFAEQRRVREAPINWAAIKTRCELKRR